MIIERTMRPSKYSSNEEIDNFKSLKLQRQIEKEILKVFRKEISSPKLL